jgi:branched-chain amino acid transport system permease protein
MTPQDAVARIAEPLRSPVWHSSILAPLPILFALAAAMPLFGNDYWILVATRAAVYWTLVSGLTLVVGFAGQLAIGWVALLTLGAYVASVLAAGNVLPPLPAFAALGAAGVVGAIFGVIVGLPALRLRTFYFAMTTLGFATIVTQIALAWQDVTGGGIGLPGPDLPAPFDTPPGLFYLCLAVAALCTWMVCNIAASRFGRALVAIRDADVAASAAGISKPRLLVMVFLLSGALAAIAGGLFASLQTYITPDAFTFDLSILFFISILIGGRGSVLGPLLGTIILTLLPEFAAPLAAWSTFVYAVLLLLIVLVAPGGIAALIGGLSRTPPPGGRVILPDCREARRFAPATVTTDALDVADVSLSFGGVRAINGASLQIRPGQIHGLIGPNGSGKTTILNVISGYYPPDAGDVTIGARALVRGRPEKRAAHGIARTFQTPRIVGEATVIENVMIGGTVTGRASFLTSLMCLPRHRADEESLRSSATAALRTVGLDSLAQVQAGQLQHSELRFLEIARALVLRPAFLLLDEPAAGLSPDEIARLGQLIRAIAEAGAGVLVVEHHADLIFDICNHVTVLNLGQVLAAGSPDEIRAHKEVVSVYLGG